MKCNFTSFNATKNKLEFFLDLFQNFLTFTVRRKILIAFFSAICSNAANYLNIFDLTTGCRSCGCSDNIRKAKIIMLTDSTVINL